MTTLWEILGAIVALGGIVGLVLYYYRRSVATAVDLKQANAATAQEAARVAAMEAAQSAARAERAKEFNAKADAARTAGDAARLLDAAGTDDDQIN